ncbi:unnamed protein product, partial [Allacma fusca]
SLMPSLCQCLPSRSEDLPLGNYNRSPTSSLKAEDFSNFCSAEGRQDHGSSKKSKVKITSAPDPSGDVSSSGSSDVSNGC